MVDLKSWQLGSLSLGNVKNNNNNNNKTCKLSKYAHFFSLQQIYTDIKRSAQIEMIYKAIKHAVWCKMRTVYCKI